MRCSKCGKRLYGYEVHDPDICLRQQEINRQNLDLSCSYCGEKIDHKPGCPVGKDLKRMGKDEETVKQDWEKIKKEFGV